VISCFQTETKNQLSNNMIAFARPLAAENTEEERKKARTYTL